MKVAIISGKGGSGKSSVTAAFVALSREMVAVDCDVDASNLPLLFSHKVLGREGFASSEDIVVDEQACVGCGRCVEVCAFHALNLNAAGIATPQDFMCEGCGLCVDVCPQHALHIERKESSDIFTSSFEHGILIHGRLCPGDDNSGKMIARMRLMADSMMPKDTTAIQILDGPPGIGCPVLSTVTGMDCIVLVAEPTLSGIADLHRAYRVAAGFCENIKVVINKCDVNVPNTETIRDFCKVQNIPVVAALPFDRKMVEAQLHCQSIVDYAPESLCAAELRAAYAKIFVA